MAESTVPAFSILIRSMVQEYFWGRWFQAFMVRWSDTPWGLTITMHSAWIVNAVVCIRAVFVEQGITCFKFALLSAVMHSVTPFCQWKWRMSRSSLTDCHQGKDSKWLALLWRVCAGLAQDSMFPLAGSTFYFTFLCYLWTEYGSMGPNMLCRTRLS